MMHLIDFFNQTNTRKGIFIAPEHK